MKMTTDNGRNLPATLRRLRGEIPQAETARRCGITQTSYNRYEAGKVMPKVAALLKIAAHYGLTIDKLMSGAGVKRLQETETPKKDSCVNAALTKQRRWQLKMLAAGRCQQCGAPRVAGSAVHCAACREKDRRAGRNRYRRRAGIPIDLPVHAARGLRRCG